MTVEKNNNLEGLKLHDLRCFDAVVRTGSFQAAARALNRSHPSVFTAVGRLEARLGIALLDRSGYRTVPTAAGLTIHARVVSSLAEIGRLAAEAARYEMGDEPVLRIVLGDLCPRPWVLKLLSAFFESTPTTRLHLDYEAIGGPFERLMDGSADLIFHKMGTHDHEIEGVGLIDVSLIPVAAPHFFSAGHSGDLLPHELRQYTQCIIRDSMATTSAEEHFLIEGAHRCSVPDHVMKRELILHGLAWGHLPDFMVEKDLREERLIRVPASCLLGRKETVGVSRRRYLVHGPVARKLWGYIMAEMPVRPACSAPGHGTAG